MTEGRETMRRGICLFLILSLCLCLWGCGGGEAPESSSADGREYQVYYVNQQLTKLTAETVRLPEEDAAGTAGRLLDRMQENPESMDLICVIPEEVKVTRTQVNENQLFVYFNAAYNGMEPVREILCRAAVVKTLTQIPGIEYVGFYINDQPLMDASNNTINLMTASSFVENSGSDTAELQRAELTLYFADETGSRLVEIQRTVIYSTGISMESLVVGQLLEGARDGEDVYDTLPENAKALQVSVRNGTCYVNFDSAFIDSALNVSDYIPVYSVVNSLTELPNISRVVISVDGNSNVKLRDLSLEQPFERNLDYVESAGTAESGGASQ